MINHDSSKPKYIQLAEALEKQILSGEFKAGDKLYSENELCQKFNVSRITVRQSFQILESKGLIYTVHGKGTFVKMQTFSQNLPQIVSFREMLSLKKLDGSTQIHSFATGVRNEVAEQHLQASRGTQLYNLNLTAYVQDTPVAFYQSFFQPELGEKVHKFANNMIEKDVPFTTYDAYSSLDITLDRVEQTIMAVNADEELAMRLKLPQNTALILLESVFFDSADKPVEYKIGHYRSDVYSFHLKRIL